MAQISEVYNVTFHREMFNRPVLQTLGKKFRVTVTIRRASLSEEGGWAEIRFEGDEEEVGRVIADLQTTGANTTGPLTDLVETDYDEPVVLVGRGT